MTAEQMPIIPEKAKQATIKGSHPANTEIRSIPKVEILDIDGEKFKVKKGFIWSEIVNGVEIPFNINIYDHEASNTRIITRSLGLNNPISEPALVRADYGCFCMQSPESFITPNHDCRQQKNLAIETLADIQIGTVALVSEIVANGHGYVAGFEQSTTQYEARQNGIKEPSMYEFFTGNGYEPFDNRPHDIISKAIADTVGKERPVIAAMDSNTKVQELKNAGLNVVEGIRVSLVTDLSGRNEHSLRRDNYAERPDVYKTGAYLKFDRPNGQSASIPLVKETYDILYRPNSLDLPRRVPVLTSQVVN